MNRLCLIVCIWAGIAGATPAFAQFIPPPPELQNRIPAPLPPPAEAPRINGPLGQDAPPEVASPHKLRTHGDLARRCLQEGAGYGLRGAKLDAYARSCTNAN